MLKRAILSFLLSALTAYGQGRYFRIIEGDRYEFWHQDTGSAGGTGPSHSTGEGKTLIVVSDVHEKRDSLRFTLQVRDSSHSTCQYSPTNCLGLNRDFIYSFSMPLLYAHGILFTVSTGPDSQEWFSPYHKAPLGTFNRVPRFLADTLSDPGDPTYHSRVVRIGNDGLKFTDPVDTAYYLAGFGPVYSKHWSTLEGWQTASEKFALISLNGIPFHLEDYFTVNDPVPVRGDRSTRNAVHPYSMNFDLLGRRIASPDPSGPFGAFAIPIR